MMKSYAQWVIRWRVWVIFSVLVLVACAASGGQFLKFKNDYRMFFSEDNPQLTAFENLQNTYTKNDNILIALAPKDGRVFTQEVMAVIEKLTNDAWQVPYSGRVDSMTNFQHTFADGDHLVVDDLVRDAEHLSSEALARIKTIALHEPFLINRLISPKADVTGVNITLQFPGVDKGGHVPEVVAFVRKMVETLRSDNPDLQIYLTGGVMMDNAFPEASKRDLQTLVPFMILIVIVTMGFMLRAVTGTLVTVLVIFFSSFSAMGLAGWLGINLSPASVTAPTIILTIAVADCVHILTGFFYGIRNGIEKRQAMIESVRINFQPVFLTSFTTGIGFLSMNFSDAPPFRDLGNITAMGVGIAFVLSVTLLPAIMIVLPVRVRQRATQTNRAMERMADWVIGKRNRLFWGMIVMIVGLIACIPQNELNDEFIKYFDETVEFRQATDFVTDNLTGLYFIDYSLGAGESGGISEPAFLAKVEDFANWYREQPEVLHVSAITDIFKRLNTNMHGDDPAWYRLPETRELAAQYLLLYEMSLPYGLDLNDRIDVDKSATRLSATLKNLSTHQVLALEQRAQAWLETHAQASMQVHGSSPTIMFAHIGQRNINSMLIGVAVALVLISLILVFTLRSVKMGLVSLVPNLVPPAMAFGLWGLIVGQVGLADSVAAAMTLGIVVDDTVHFLSKYLHARREQGLDVYDAVRYAFVTVGTAMWVTSMVLMAGFAVLAFSSFQINAGMGLLTALAIGLALFADMLFLPPLLMKIEEKKHETDTVFCPADRAYLS